MSAIKNCTLVDNMKTSRTEFGLQMRSRSYLYPFIILLLVVFYYYYLKVAQIDILFCFGHLSHSILVKDGTFIHFQLVCDRRTDRRTDGQTDTPSYRDARTHLKSEYNRTRLGPLHLACHIKVCCIEVNYH